MKIDKNNIQEVIFDYYEGNLAHEEKAALMEFIHQNPQFEGEFVLWAKTYHGNKELLDYGNNDRFYKKQYPGYIKWFLPSAAGIMAALLYLFSSTEDKSTGAERKTIIPRTADTVITPAQPTVKSAKAEKIKLRSAQQEKLVKVQDKKEPLPVMAPADTILISEIEKPSPTVTEDSVPHKEELKQAETPQTNKKPEANEKKKKRRKLDLTPTDNILPFNSDF